MRVRIILAVLTCALAAPVTAHARTSPSAAQVKSIIRQVFGPTAAKAIRVAGCETGWTFDNHAIGSAGERSIFQIHPVHFGWANPSRLYNDVWYASRIAYRMSRGGTRWGAWSCSWA